MDVRPDSNSSQKRSPPPPPPLQICEFGASQNKWSRDVPIVPMNSSCRGLSIAQPQITRFHVLNSSIYNRTLKFVEFQKLKIKSNLNSLWTLAIDVARREEPRSGLKSKFRAAWMKLQPFEYPGGFGLVLDDYFL